VLKKLTTSKKLTKEEERKIHGGNPLPLPSKNDCWKHCGRCGNNRDMMKGQEEIGIW